MVKSVFLIVCATILVAVTDAMLLIESPLTLRDKFKNGVIKASYANFGYIPYGHTMVSIVTFICIISCFLGFRLVESTSKRTLIRSASQFLNRSSISKRLLAKKVS